MVGYEHLLVEREGPVGWIILDRPRAANAINSGMRDELPRAWAELDDDDDIRVIVTTGSGRAFCAGADVKELADDPRGMAIHEDVIRTRLTLTAIHNDVMKPVICAVNGICAGGGLHFVADADIVVSSSDAVFLDPHVSVGQVSVYETVGLLARMPLGSVARMALTGVHERMDAREAHRLGLVSEVVDPPESLRPAVQGLAEKIARNSPSAMIATKQAIWGALDRGLGDALSHGAEILMQFWGHPDNREGPAAFATRSTPQWGPPRRTSG